MPKVTIYGPRNDNFTWVSIGNDRRVRVDNPFIVDVDTLEDCLLAYSAYFQHEVDGFPQTSEFIPAPGPPGADHWQDGEEPRYFIFVETAERSMYVDAHVRRGDLEICPKQDLAFAMQDGDILEIGILVC